MQPCARFAHKSAEIEEVIMTGKKNYVPCVDLKNVHIPLT
jgi:hypothetical protein